MSYFLECFATALSDTANTTTPSVIGISQASLSNFSGVTSNRQTAQDVLSAERYFRRPMAAARSNGFPQR